MQTDEYLQVARDSPARSKMVARTQRGSSKRFAPGVHLWREDPKERRGSIRRTYIVARPSNSTVIRSRLPAKILTPFMARDVHSPATKTSSIDSDRMDPVSQRNRSWSKRSKREVLYFTTRLAVPIVVLFTFVANRKLVSVSPRCADSGDTLTII